MNVSKKPGWRSLSLALVGAVLGATMLTPAFAGGSDPATKAFVRKVARNKAKARANSVKNQLQPQIDGKVDQCEPGSILASGVINGSGGFSGSYVSSNSSPASFGPTYNCASPTNEFKALRVQEGVYDVSLPGISTVATGDIVAAVTPFDEAAGFPDETFASYITIDGGAEGRVLRVSIRDQSGGDAGLEDEPFSIIVTQYA